MKRTIIIICSVAILSLVIFRLTTNYQKVQLNKNVSTDLPFVSVNVTSVTRMKMSDSLWLTGNMEATADIDVASGASGIIITVQADLGQKVAKGEVIAAIDDKLSRLEVQKAGVMVEKLKKDLTRFTNLYSGGSATEQQVAEAQNLYDNARIQLEQAEKRLSDATIKSPIQGIIVKRFAESGEYINIGSPIATVVDISKLKIKLNVSETNIYQLHVNDRVKITTDIYPGVVFDGVLSNMGSKGDESHNYPVEIEITNSITYPLRSGTFANVLIHVPETAEALYIPRESLLGSINNAAVYVAENNLAIRKRIVVGKGNDTYIQVVSGLKEGEKVIVNGLINLADNKPIRIIN